MLALIDGDILLYRSAFASQDDSQEIACARAGEMLELILHEINADEYQCWLSDSTKNNFRTKFYPEYKANRTQPKPKHYQAVKDYLIKSWKAVVTKGQEADDALGINQNKNSIICSIDKDLHQVPGMHYNFVKKEELFVTPEEGLRFFYRQLLTGDPSDNLQGCPKVGKALSERILYEVKDKSDLGYFREVRKTYHERYKKSVYCCDSLSEERKTFIDNELLKNGVCLKIRQKEGEIWTFPELNQTVD